MFSINEYLGERFHQVQRDKKSIWRHPKRGVALIRWSEERPGSLSRDCHYAFAMADRFGRTVGDAGIVITYDELVSLAKALPLLVEGETITNSIDKEEYESICLWREGGIYEESKRPRDGISLFGR